MLVMDCAVKFRRCLPNFRFIIYIYNIIHHIGAAHGLSGILQMLLSFPSFLEKNPGAEKDVQGNISVIDA